MYEYRYRSVGDVTGPYCYRMRMSAEGTSRVHRLLSKAVAEAPCSSLRRWMIESVLSHDFQYFSGMLTWFVRTDICLRHIYPDLRSRKAMFRKLTGDRVAARRMRFFRPCLQLAGQARLFLGCNHSRTVSLVVGISIDGRKGTTLTS